MLQQLSPPPAAHTQQVVVYIEASANVSPIGDDAMSWNTTPMSSIGTASPTESSQRQSVVCSYHEAVLLQEMNHHAGAGPTGDLIATMPPSPVSPIKAPCMAASAATEGHLHDGHSSCNTTMDMDDDDEIVGVTAEGELLFRKRDGGHPSEWTRRRSAPEVTTHRPTPHRTQPRPASLAVPDMTDVVSPPAEARALFAPSSAADVTPPSQLAPPPTLRDSTRRHAEQHGTPLMVLSAEEIRFAQLALRVRDRENDLFCEHVHEEFRRHAQAKDAQYQQELDARYRRAAWDLRRF